MMGRLFTVVGPIRNSLALDSDGNELIADIWKGAHILLRNRGEGSSPHAIIQTGLECPAFGGLRVVARILWRRATAERIALQELRLRCGAASWMARYTSRVSNHLKTGS